MSLPLPIPKTLQHLRTSLTRQPGVIKAFPTEGLKALRLNMPVPGLIILHFDAKEEGSLTAAGETLLLPKRVERVGDTLWVEGNDLKGFKHHGRGRNKQHKVQIDLHLPADLDIHMAFIAGAVMVNGGTGKLHIRGKFGEIAGVSASDDVRIDLRTGEVVLNELRGKTDIELMYGAVKLGWTALSGEERVRIHCALGGVELLLPSGSGVKKDKGGVFVNHHIRTSEGAEIHTTVGLGGLEVKDWSKQRKGIQQVTDAVTEWLKQE